MGRLRVVLLGVQDTPPGRPRVARDVPGVFSWGCKKRTRNAPGACRGRRPGASRGHPGGVPGTSRGPPKASSDVQGPIQQFQLLDLN